MEKTDDTKLIENPRGNWGGKVEFLLSCVGYAVGLGNIWRFPYLAYKHGGGAFLVPYVIMLTIIGLPLFFMELAFGQFASLGPISLWKAVPLFKGIGWGMITLSFLVGLYYNIIMAWTLFYFFASMTSQLPWEHCTEDWNTPLCAEVRGGESLLHEFNGQVYEVGGLNKSYLNQSWINHFDAGENNSIDAFTMYNVTCKETSTNGIICYLVRYPAHLLWHFGLRLVSPAEEYWDNRVLRRSAAVDEPGEVLWDLTLCLLLAWIIVCLCLIKGVKSVGKVVYFTATFPYVVLTILLVRGCLLEGAIDGIKFYIIPEFSKLSDPTVWKDAAAQIFYSLGVGFGGLHIMASYNKFNNNCLSDAITVALINCCTSVYAGFAIFSMVGYLSFKTKLPVQEAATDGPGLAFVAYPEGITQMPAAPLWSLLFFFMLINLGLDSQFAMVESIISGLSDEFPSLFAGERRIGRITVSNKMTFTIGLCCCMFLLGLPMTTKGGVYWFQLLDAHAASHSLLLVVLFEVIGIVYVYGIKNFLADIELMVGRRSPFRWAYFVVCWTVLSPLAIILVFISACVEYRITVYEDVVFPGWLESIGWMIAVSSMIMIPLWMVVIIYQTFRQLLQNQEEANLPFCIRLAAQPKADWGPALNSDREGTKYHLRLQATPQVRVVRHIAQSSDGMCFRKLSATHMDCSY